MYKNNLISSQIVTEIANAKWLHYFVNLSWSESEGYIETQNCISQLQIHKGCLFASSVSQKIFRWITLETNGPLFICYQNYKWECEANKNQP